MILTKFLDWDSNLFCISIYEFKIFSHSTLSEFIETYNTLYFNLAYVFFENPNLEIEEWLIKHQHKLCDRKVTYFKNISSKNINFQNLKFEFELIDYGTEFYNELLELSYISGEYSRFKIDPFLTNENFKILYQKWLDNSLNKSIANEVIGIKLENKLLGFATINYNSSPAKIGLIACKPLNQRIGAGSSLMHLIENKVLEKNIHEIEVVTQLDNLKACKFYEKNNYVKKNIIDIYHCWK
ncbi:MAG: GNAT family N-acetyltransferase [Cytophagales bacterium]